MNIQHHSDLSTPPEMDPSLIISHSDTLIENDPSPPVESNNFEKILEDSIQISQIKRQEKILKYDIEIKEIMEFLNKIEDLTKKIYKTNKEDERHAIDCDLKNEDFLLKKYLSEINFLPTDIPTDYPRDDGRDNKNQLKVYKEKILNAFVNRRSYEKEIAENLKYSANEISELLKINTDDFVIKFLEGESHNGGKKTCLIMNKDSSQCLAVYKPRNAEIDSAVISLFEKINELSKENPLPERILLPIYKIINIPNKNASVWEFIPGRNLSRPLKMPQKAGDFVKDLNNDELKLKLVKLDDVLSAIYMKDQHGENIIIKEIDGNIVDIVPIDLENISIPLKTTKNTSKNKQTKFYTGLGAGPVRDYLNEKKIYKNLTNNELDAIKEFNHKANDFQLRYVPVGTNSFLVLCIDIENSEGIFNLIHSQYVIDSSEKQGQEKLENKEKIIKEIMLDILNNDVPYLTEKQGIIYYGIPERGVVFGSRESLSSSTDLVQ